MNQFSSNLHTVISNFKKQFLSIGLLFFLMLQMGLCANAQCDVNPVTNQTVCNNSATTAINFTGTATTFSWTNNNTAIGLAASGTGNIASFTALNSTATAVTATVTVTPSTGACSGAPISFTITVNPSPVVNVTPAISCGGVAALGPCSPLTASGNADAYLWSPSLGLYLNCTMTAPYTGTNLQVVQAGPVSNTIYTVTGTILATGCFKTATAHVNYTPPPPVITPASVNMCLGDPAVKIKVVAGGVPARPAIWSPTAGLFADPACTIPYVAGLPRDSVWAKPTPAGVYTYQAITQSVPGPSVAFTNPAAITIPVGGAAALYSSNLTVSGLPATGVKIGSVVLNGVSHSRSSDIDVVLQSPSGQNVILMSDVGDVNAINATYTFMDWTAYMNPFAANPTGTYSPTNNGTPDNFPAPGPGSISNFSLLNTFTGNYNGTWKLFVVDDDGTGDQGIISGGYTINFDTLPVCISPARTVVVNVGQSTTITSQPVNTTVCTNGVANFSVTAAGAGPFTYQWQVSNNGPWNNITNGGIYSGATTPSLIITNPPVSMNGYYRVVINGTAICGTTNSSAVTLTVNTPPAAFISGYPLVIGPLQTSTIIANSIISTPPNILTWYYNNTILPGETSSILHVNYGSPGDYQLKVTDANNCGVGASNIVTIGNSFALNMYTYPNPSGGRFQVIYHHDANNTTNNTLQRSLIVYNNWGGKIITMNFAQTSSYQKIDVDVRAYGKGIFWVELRDANGKRLGMKRVVVQ
jgi:hypothetical protein